MPNVVATRSGATAVGSPLGYLLRVARTGALRLVLPDGTPVGEAHRDFALLSVLAKLGPRSQQQLADYLGINRTVMVKLIDGLEADGLVVRSRNTTDRRSYALAVTDAGRKRATALGSGLEQVGSVLCGQLTRAQSKRLGHLLHRLLAPRFEPPLPAGLAGSLPWLLMTAQEQMEQLGDRQLSPLGIDVRTFVSLAILAGEPCSQISLATHLFIGPAATVELVDRLEEIGAARRGRNPADRRSYLVEVTGPGYELLEAARRVVRRVIAEFTSGTTEKERQELVHLLESLVGVGSAT